MEVLVFDLWGDFAHFKKFYTTSSPLSFSFPPPTSIYGMIGAVLGFNKNEYLKYINGRTTKIAIKILSPVKKIRMSINWIDTKNSNSFNIIKQRTQIRTEFLKNPSYRLYINISNEDIFKAFIKNIKTKQSHYTISLGLANLIANFKYVGEYELEKIDISEKVDTLILVDNVKEIYVEEGAKYIKEKIPIDMNENREVLSYKSVLAETNGISIKGSFINCYSIGEEIISFISL